MVTMDIGANVGYFTLLLAHVVGPDGRVYAFEANPPVFETLHHNVGLNPQYQNGRIILRQIALGAENGCTDFFCPAPGYEGVGGLRNTHRAPIARTVKVPISTLDEIVERHRIVNLDFVKMDIEGGELDVLKGAGHVLTEMKPVLLFEAFEVNTAPYGYRVYEILCYLENRGYTVKQAGMTTNFIAVPRAKP